MDDLKLAFETIIVGLLALPWILILLDLLLQPVGRDLLTEVRNVVTQGDSGNTMLATLAGALLLAICYVLGSILAEPADAAFEQPILLLSSDDAIIRDTYLDSYSLDARSGKIHLESAQFPLYLSEEVETIKASLQSDEAGEDNVTDAVKALFKYQRFYNFTHSEKGYDHLREIYSQIVVLRGVALNALLTFAALLCTLVSSVFTDRDRTKMYLLGMSMALVVGFYFVVGYAWQQLEHQYNSLVIGIYHSQYVPATIFNE